MSRFYPGISEPEQTIESMHNTILELKQAVETLTGQRGTPETVTADTAQALAQSLVTASFATTISGGVITLPTETAIVYLASVETESAAASDDLDTIRGGRTGTILVIRANNSGREVIVKDGTGNLALAGDHSLDDDADTITLMRRDSNTWVELGRANNA